MSNFEIKPVRKAGLTVHPTSGKAGAAVDRLLDALKNHGIEVKRLDDGTPPDSNVCDVVVSVGGDGTLLAAARSACSNNLPVWGINVGRLGFLTTSTINEIEDGVARIAEGNYSVESRAMLEADVVGAIDGGSHLIALNDIVIHRKSIAGLITLETYLDGRFLLTYEGDGLIVSTPTGSTAYSMAAGGSILSPTLRAFILTPVCPHSLSARSLVVDDTSEVSVRPQFEHPDDMVSVIADGQTSSMLHSPAPGTGSCAVNIRRSKQNAGLVRFGDIVFSDVLRDKLGWAGGAAQK